MIKWTRTSSKSRSCVTSAARASRSCVGRSLRRCLPNFVDLGAEPPADGGGGSFARFFDGLPSTLATRSAAAARKSLFSQGRESCRCSDRDKLGNKRALKELYKCFAWVEACVFSGIATFGCTPSQGSSRIPALSIRRAVLAARIPSRLLGHLPLLLMI